MKTRSYKMFRASLRPGELALLYEINYCDRRAGQTVIEISEAKVQGPWRRQGFVPADAVNYLQANRARLTQQNRVIWSLRLDMRMLQLLMQKVSFLETAYQLSCEFKQRITVGTIKGRRYNALPAMSLAELRQYGLSEPQRRFVRNQPSRARARVR